MVSCFGFGLMEGFIVCFLVALAIPSFLSDTRARVHFWTLCTSSPCFLASGNLSLNTVITASSQFLCRDLKSF